MNFTTTMNLEEVITDRFVRKVIILMVWNSEDCKSVTYCISSFLSVQSLSLINHIPLMTVLTHHPFK